MIIIIINCHTVSWKELSNAGAMALKDGLSWVGKAIKRYSENDGICIVFLRPICLTFLWDSQSQSMFCLLCPFIHSHWPLSHPCFASGLSSDLQTLYLLVIELRWLRSPNSQMDLSFSPQTWPFSTLWARTQRHFTALSLSKDSPAEFQKGEKKASKQILSVEGDLR